MKQLPCETEYDVRDLKYSQLCSRGLLASVALLQWLVVSRHLETFRGSMRPRNLGPDYALALRCILEWNSVIAV